MAKQDIKAGGAFVELLLKDNKFVKGLAAAKAKLASFAKAAALAGTAIAAASAATVAVGVKNFLALGDELDKMRQRTGLSVEALSELKHAAGQSGASLGDVENGVRRMQKSLTDARSGLKTAVDSFDKLGLSVDELQKLNPEQQFDAVAKAIGSIEDPTTRAGLAMEILGKSGTKLLPMIEDMDALREEARQLGFVMSGDAAASAVRVGDMFANLWNTLKMGTVVIGGAVAPILEALLPAFQKFATGAMQAVAQFSDFMRPILIADLQAVQTIFTSIGEIVAAVMGNVAGNTSNAMTWLQDTIIDSLSAVAFGFKNWRSLVDIALVGAAHGVVKFGNQVIYFFSEVIPGYLSWFGNNWRDIFTDVYNFTGTVLGNLWDNLVKFWAQLFQWLQGGEFSFAWTNLTEGFESAIKELPKIAEREIGGLEKELSDELKALQKSLGEEWEQHQKDFRHKVDNFQAEAVTPGGAAAPALDAMAGFDANKARKEVFVAFTAAAAVAGGRGQGEDRAQNTRERMVRVLERIERNQENEVLV